MSVDSLIFWLFVGAWVVVASIILFGVLPQIVGEVRRIIGHVTDLVEKSPLPLQLSKAEADVARIEAAAARLPALQRRAEAAVAVIRSTPIVPPQIGALIRRIQIEIAGFRRQVR